MRQFYVYELLDERNNVFYIGKGKNGRYLESKRKRQAASAHVIVNGLSEQEAFELERFMIDEIGRIPHGPLINRCVGGYGASGWKKSPELCARMAEFHRGQKRSKDTREAISNSLRGRNVPAEVGEKISMALTGRKASREVAERLRTMNVGRPCPEGTRAAIIESNKRRRGTKWSEERRAMMAPIRARQGERQRGRKLSQETREKISVAKRRSKLTYSTGDAE